MPRRKFLAASCKDGSESIRRLWELLKKEVVEPSFNDTRFEPFSGDKAFRQPARRLMKWFSHSSSDNTEPAGGDAQLEETILCFLTLIADPRSSYTQHSTILINQV